jgi:hypothetical protein
MEKLMKMKANGVFFIFCIWILFSACPILDRETSLENKYPSDIIVPEVGTLKYTRTLWDQNTRNNRRGDTDISNAKKIDDEIWTLAGTDIGYTLIKGLNKSALMSINIPDIKNDFRYGFLENTIISKGDYIVFLLRDGPTYYEDKMIWTYYIARVHRTTLQRQYIRLPKFDGMGQPQIYYGNDDVFFCFDEYDDSINEFFVSYCYMLNDDCDDVIEITEQEFDNKYIPEPNFITDDKGRYYRLYDGQLEVSLDNGLRWYSNDMGTNVTKSIIVQNDSIYVFCSHISEPSGLFGLDGEFVGGGIHEFVWK